HAPLQGIEAGGWKLVYNDAIPSLLKARESVSESTDVSYSLGFQVKSGDADSDRGKIVDVLMDSPAYRSGIAPGMTLVAVQGRKWTPEILRDAIRSGKGSNTPLELLIRNGDFYQTMRVDYHD